MDACIAVERELDKVHSKFSSLNKSIKLDVDKQIKLLTFISNFDKAYNFITKHL